MGEMVEGDTVGVNYFDESYEIAIQIEFCNLNKGHKIVSWPI